MKILVNAVYKLNLLTDVNNIGDDAEIETEQYIDDWIEEIPAGATDTMLTATDFLQDSERVHL